MSLTEFMPKVEKTDKTGETDTLSNDEFLLTVFCDAPADFKPVVVSFVGNPNTVHGSSWHGQPWVRETSTVSDLPVNANNYFSLATFLPDETGQYQRQKTRFRALHAIMLDDVGTKVAVERLTLPPSWLLETSPDNYQVGYLLSEPIEDVMIADRLMKTIINAGLCDPGASGPSTRMARLPIAANGKHTPPFVCRTTRWEPQLRYSVKELTEGLQLENVEVGRPKRQGSTDAQKPPVEGDPVWVPRPNENAVLKALHESRLYKSLLQDGKHDITCPWVKEHTDAADGGTAYFEPGENWFIGGFKCLHGHCAERNIHDLLKFLNIEIQAARMRPTIRVVAGEIDRVVDAAERELAQSGRYYQRGGRIATVVTDPGSLGSRVQEISPPALVRALASVALWVRFDCRVKDWVRIDPPARHIAVLYEPDSYPHLPVLNGLAHQPYLRPDGSLMKAPLYDPVTGMFGVFDAREFSVPEAPDRSDAEAALAVLQELLSEFCFATDSDRAAALAAILTAAIRPSLALAPMFHVRAHMVGSGKSYLCELITSFATAQRSTPTTFPADDEECRKLLLAELMRAPAVIEFDNLTSDLMAHKSLCTALTSEFLTGRILGASRTASVSTRTLFLSSGNNVGPVQDMTRRCITINLDPGIEVPAARNFKRPDLIRDVRRQRGHFVSAALTIVRAWVVAGKPKSECKSLASYSDWSDLCRQSLLWLDCADPIASVFEAITEDPDREMLARLLTSWHSVFGSTPTRVRDAVQHFHQLSDTSRDLREAIHDIADERGEINRRKLGWWIRRHAGRPVNGLRFTRSSGNSSAEKWRVESV